MNLGEFTQGPLLPESGAGSIEMTQRDVCIENSECQLWYQDLIA